MAMKKNLWKSHKSIPIFVLLQDEFHWNRNATTFMFGRIYVVKPKCRHQATIVWLHDLGDIGSSWTQLLENLQLLNVKWICPTAPTRPVTLFGGLPSTACKQIFSLHILFFLCRDLSEDNLSDLDGLDASSSYIANLLAAEPPDVKLGVGGFGMGAATALYSATCQALGRYANGSRYPIKLSAVIADEVVAFKQGQKSAETLASVGFQSLIFKGYQGLGHYTIPQETTEMCNWLKETLVLNVAMAT
ncbi:hypothetical protein V2J09_019630 [Rumex salicifolius]